MQTYNLNKPKSINMAQGLGLDWYSVHKLNSERFDIRAFNEVVGNCQIGYGIDNVSLLYRKKLLVLFQNASKIIKMEMPELSTECSQLFMKKNLLAQKIARREQELQTSFQEISNMRMILLEKKRTLNKLKQKVAKKQKKQEKKIYFCSFCEREDFQSLEALKGHISSAHQNKNIENRSETSNQVNEIKDLLMTMKDKEMEMMSMFLRASREMQTQKLQKDYEHQYKRYMQISGTKTDESKEQNQLQELKGESKFIFFKKSDQMIRETAREQQFRSKMKNQRDDKQEKLQNQFYNQRNYYNIFKNIEQNVSDQIEDSNRNLHKKTEESNQGKSVTYYDPNEFLSKFLKNNNISQDSRFSLVENTPKPYLEIKQTKLIEKQQVYVSPSISDRLRQINKKKDTKMETMFSTKRRFYEDSGYVFNSGPLLDDKGGDSDYEDYFGHNAASNEIEDEQIKMHPVSSNKSYYPASKESFHLSKLLSPKESNSFIEKSEKEKSSVIVDLSDSFSRRDFQISKDDDTINLSDLKLSKLQKKREEERLRKLKEIDEKKSFVSDSNVDNKSHSKEVPSGLEYSKVSKVSKESVKVEPKEVKGGRIDILKDFQRQKVTPLVEQNFRFQQENVMNRFIRKNQRINVLANSEDVLRNKFDPQGPMGILGQFLKKQHRISPGRWQSNQTEQLKDFLKK